MTTDWQKKWLVTTIWQMTKIDTWTTDWPVTTNWQMTKKKMTNDLQIDQKKWLVATNWLFDKKSD